MKSRMVKFGLVALLAMSQVLVVATPAPAADEEWTVEGGGWGHGIGLSQFGAFGMAQDGHGAAEILAYYYTGTNVDRAADLLGAGHWLFQPEALWVGLRQSDTTLDVSAVGGPLRVCQPSPDCSHADFTIAPGEKWKLEHGENENEGLCRFRHIDGNEGYGPCNADLSWEDDGATRVMVDGKEYAHGTLRIRAATAGEFHTALSIGLEKYLYGLAEVPASWPEEALKAQAIIGRGYAIATALIAGGDSGNGRRSSCACHILDDTRDQAYNGWAKENETSGGINYGLTKWRPAVDATGTGAGHLVVTHPEAPGSTIISAFYSSSNGGASENNEDVWGGPPLPWLRSVEDPWSADPAINPLARWEVFVSESVLQSRLCDAGHCWDHVSGAEMISGPPGARIRFIGLIGRDLVAAEVPAVWLYNALNAEGTETDPAGGRRPARVSPYILGVNAPSPFLDVGTSVHYENIRYIADLGITKGCNPPDNTLFCPGNSVTRQQMASFLARTLNLPTASEDHFGDDAGSVHENTINALAAAGITKGCNPPANDRFCPDRALTRGEMAAFLVRAFGYEDPGAGNLFVDDDSSIFHGDIDRLATAGVTNGCNPPANDRFCPEDPVTREQMASFLARALSG